MKNQKLFQWLNGRHGNHKCPIIVAIYVTIETTNLNITLFVMLHIGWLISASEMKTKSENIL